MKPLKDVIFRCDFGGKTGWGHVVRCSALADALCDLQVATTLLTRGEVGTLPRTIRECFQSIIQIDEKFPGIGLWKKLLGADANLKAIVVDHYSYRGNKLNRLKDLGSRLVIIDDDTGADLSAADLVVNPGMAVDLKKYSHSGKLLAGSAYALLRSEFSKAGKMGSHDAGEPNSVLIMPGGTDPYDIGAILLEWLAGRVGESLRPVVAGSREVLDRPSVQKALGKFTRYECLHDAGPADLSNWMSVCAYGITACGGTVYEMAATGLPFLGVTVADNQRDMGSAIIRNWGLPILEKDALCSDSLNAAWDALRRDYPTGRRLQIKGLDGRGASRVAGEILRL